MLQFSKSSRKPENQMRNFSSPNAPPRGSPSRKKPSFTFDLPKCSLFYIVTQPMLQRQLNRTELRLMDSFIQILCRFQKCKRKVPPPDFFLWSPKVGFEKKNFFEGDGGGTFHLHFWNLHKIWI